ncbi:hypothetical protein ACHAXR_009132 [Thalassiosira sp. AJA248-18]
MAHRKLTQRLSANSAAFLAAGVGWQCINVNDERTSLPPSIGLPSFRAACENTNSETESQRFNRALAHHRSQISSYRDKWEYRANSSATTSTKTPSRSWPDDVPPNEELGSLLEDVKYCARSPNFRSDKDYCSRLSFRVASALLMQFDDESQKKGFDMLKALAETGYPDAMVYYGMCLNDGRANMDPNSDAAVSWFKRCSDTYEHPQSLYELGVAFYTGEGVVEDEEEAVRLFQGAAEQSHPAACYMLGDCLLDGTGVEMDRGLAMKWLVRAAELGHRGARSRVMAVLEKKEGEDYAGFTDASRQSLVEHTVHSANEDGQIVRRKTTLRRKIGDGVRNPSELARRQTIVSKSRKDL